MTGQPTSKQASGASKESDSQYIKAIPKSEIKVTKLNSDNYQSWANSIRFFLDAKKRLPIINNTESLPDLNNRPIDHKA